ncbi:MAG: AAA family ATPase [bacterium]|nr:AAA family ATPase [bacterium]
MTIDLTEQFQRALDAMESTSRNIFITGRAGTGKSTLLDYFRNNTRKKIVVLAPTGVAAINVKGQTIHSFFGFKPDITVNKAKRIAQSNDDDIYKNLDAIVIDEISMVRADLMDCVDTFMRIKGKTKHMPFGGVQMIMIGDLYQLPPIVTTHEKEMFEGFYETPYFFSAKGWSNDHNLFNSASVFDMDAFALETIYRQKDEQFISILNAIRDTIIGQEMLSVLNTRVDHDFQPPQKERYVTLTTTNKNAAQINTAELDKRPGREYTLHGTIKGSIEDRDLPTDTVLRVKKGAQIMMLNNDPDRQWVNGSIGVIEDITNTNTNVVFGDEEESDGEIETEIIVRLENGHLVNVTRHRWDIFKFSYDTSAGNIISEPVASFTQYPLKLAWAITIHKSQGKTFHRVIVDMERGAFSAGQTYVALSRCTSLNGLVLRKPIRGSYCWIDQRVVHFMQQIGLGTL